MSEAQENMPIGYHFVIQDSGKAEPLGTMPLKGDEEARLFGEGIVRDLMQDNAAQYSGRTMDIFHGQRLAVSIPFAQRES